MRRFRPACPLVAKDTPEGRGSVGFTMLELLVVLLLIGVLSAVVVSRYPSIARYDLVSETETLKGHLRYAQLRAISGLATWGIQLANTHYTLVRNGATAPFSLPGENSPVRNLPAGISISAGSGTLISFDSWGSPGAANLSVTLNSSAEARTIVVGRNTGFIP
jgi:prepilin-type N-terminal cleavage/methylation domain-containing protein